MLRLILTVLVTLCTATAQAEGIAGRFTSIDGGTIALENWRGQPILVVNTASRCAYTNQYDGLQALYDRYKSRGLVVLAVPSDDFRQELGSSDEVKEFCEMNFDLTLPMTQITPVRGGNAHPFFKAVEAGTGFVPRWNFNKILIGPDGQVVQTWGSGTRPNSRAITRRIEAFLAG